MADSSITVSPTSVQRSPRAWTQAFAVLLAVTACAGCPSGSSTTGGNNATDTDNATPVNNNQERANPAAQAEPKTPAELVARMREVYAQAQAYSDDGVLQLQVLQANRSQGESWQPVRAEFTTHYVRPNKLSLVVRGLRVVSNGKSLRAVIEDEATDNYDGQFLERKAPENLHLADLYSDVEIQNILGDAVFDSTPWPLRLLTNDPAINAFLSGEIGAMSDQPIDGVNYRRVRVRYQQSAATLWIHPQTYLLRRVELPPPSPEFGVRTCVAEYVNAQINDNAQIAPQQFRLQQPAQAKLVHFFVPPPIAVDLPTPLFGKKVDKFQFVTGTGKKVTERDLAAKANVLVWFLDNDSSKQTLQQLQAVAAAMKDERDVRFYAVSPLPDAVTSGSITQSLAEWGVSIPLLRDTAGAGRDTFDVPGAPTLVVLDGQQRVQGFKAGTDPYMTEYLPDLLKRLIAGENPAGELAQMVAEENAHYRQQLAAAQSDSSSTVLELSETPLAPASNPSKMKLTKLWTSSEIGEPGNITVVPTKDGQSRILVHDHETNWRTLVELDAAGKLVARHELPVKDDAAIALLKTVVDHEGRRWYAAGAKMGPQVFVFDEEFKLAFAYPDAPSREAQISDFALVNFRDDAPPQLCVGFWGVIGMHGVDLSGKRQWTNRAAAPILNMATSPQNEAGWRQVLAVNDQGVIVPVNGFGRDDPSAKVEGYTITQLHSANFSHDRSSAYVGMSVQANGNTLAVALSPEMSVEWDVPLPAGFHRNQIQPVTSGQLIQGGAGEWVFANADGTIGIVSDDLSFYDSFATGQRLSGVAVAPSGGIGMLLLSTPDGVTAWRPAPVLGPAAP